MKHTALLLALAGCGAAPGAVQPSVAAAQAKTYAVHFVQPAHVGERTRILVDHHEEMVTRISRDDAVVSDKRDVHSIHCEAVSNVVAVDPEGRATRIRYEVKDLTSDGLRIPASIIDLTRHAAKKDAEILIDGAPASDDVRKVLSSLFKLGLDGATDDDVFGTKTSRPLGAHWPLNGALAAASLKEEYGLGTSSVTGEVWLDGTTRIGGADFLAVRATLDLKGLEVPGMPAGAEVERSDAESEMRAALPIDGRAGRPEDHQSTTMSFQLRVRAPDGSPVKVTVDGKQSQDSSETAL